MIFVNALFLLRIHMYMCMHAYPIEIKCTTEKNVQNAGWI